VKSHRLTSALVFILGYAASIGVVMFLNTALFGLGDPVLGTDGWQVYWPLWGAFFLPLAITGLAITWSLPAEAATLRRLYVLFWSFLVVAVEVSFVFDARFLGVLLAYTATIGGFVLVASRLSRRGLRA